MKRTADEVWLATHIIDYIETSEIAAPEVRRAAAQTVVEAWNRSRGWARLKALWTVARRYW